MAPHADFSPAFCFFHRRVRGGPVHLDRTAFAEDVVARASRPCESCNQHTGGTPVTLPTEHQTPEIQRFQGTARAGRRKFLGLSARPARELLNTSWGNTRATPQAGIGRA